MCVDMLKLRKIVQFKFLQFILCQFFTRGGISEGVRNRDQSQNDIVHLILMKGGLAMTKTLT